MASPQTGIFALGTASHAYLELDATSDAAATRRGGRLAPRAEDDDGRCQPRRRLPARAVARSCVRRTLRQTLPGSTPTSPGSRASSCRRRNTTRCSGSREAATTSSSTCARRDRGARRPGDGRRGDLELAVPPRPRPDGLHRRDREPDARRGAPGGGSARRQPRRRRVDAAAAEVAARRNGLGSAGRRAPGGGDRPPEGRQRRARSEAGGLARREYRPGHLRQDPAAEHGLRHRHRPRDDVRRVRRGPQSRCRRCSRAWPVSRAAPATH